MSKLGTASLSLTHIGADRLSKVDIMPEFQRIQERLERDFQDQPKRRTELLNMLDALSEFELGRFLIQNKAISGYWTWYVIQEFKKNPCISPMELYLIERLPIVLATRERFDIFQRLLMQLIQKNSLVCSLPCGIMADLLTLKLTEEQVGVRFIGIDLDAAAFDLAKTLGEQEGIKNSYAFFQQDAWNLTFKEEFNLITSNGLNIYEKDDQRVVSLYRSMWAALKTGGYLICSALTPPPTMTSACEWDMDQIDKNDLATSVLLLKFVLGGAWSNFRSSEKTCEQLREAGFDQLEIYWDKQRMFPTFLARKV